MPGRKYASKAYSWGFNGKEKDDEAFLGCIAFEARIFDSRIGRFFSRDPREKDYSWQSTYAYFKNSPICILDVRGMGGGDNTGKGRTVQKGDNPYAYAKEYGMSLKELAVLNPDQFKGDINATDYWSAGKGTLWNINVGDVLNVKKAPTKNEERKSSKSDTPKDFPLGTLDYLGYGLNGLEGYLVEGKPEIFKYAQRIDRIVYKPSDLTKLDAELSKKMSKKIGFVGNLVGLADAGISTYEAFKEEKHGKMAFEGTKATGYFVGLCLLATPAAPVGGIILTVTSFVDMGGDIYYVLEFYQLNKQPKREIPPNITFGPKF